MVPTTTTAMTTTAMPSSAPMRAISFCSGVGCLAPWRPAARRSRPSRCPCRWRSPARGRCPARRRALEDHVAGGRRAPRGRRRVAASLSTASLSPVSDASCTRRAAACSSRASAPTASPSASTSRSPRTSAGWARAAAARRAARPRSRRVIRASAATASAALASCTCPSTPLSTTTGAITSASTGQPSAPSGGPGDQGDAHGGEQQVDQRVLRIAPATAARRRRDGGLANKFGPCVRTGPWRLPAR